MEYDWDSQALFGDRIIDPYPVFDYPSGLHEFQPQELLTSDCPENFEATSADFDQLEGLYRPFHPIFRQTIVTDSLTVPQDPEMKTEKLKSLQSLSAQPPAVRVAKPNKIRKNQQIRVVQHVTEDGLQSDMWAWRKYGQKPIKGSPYPRSYYKCSSLKGCLARKQVERSCSDPNIFIITYTAEHSHSEPTRRSSLAGSKRNKAKATVQLERRLSTETLPSPAMEQENKEVHDLQGGQKLEDTIVISNELVQSLEDLESLLMDQTFIDISPELWPIEDFATFMDGNS